MSMQLCNCFQQKIIQTNSLSNTFIIGANQNYEMQQNALNHKLFFLTFCSKASFLGDSIEIVIILIIILIIIDTL
jgi:hypothetical protein